MGGAGVGGSHYLETGWALVYLW